MAGAFSRAGSARAGWVVVVIVGLAVLDVGLVLPGAGQCVLAGREGVGQDVGVGGHDRVADLDGAALGVVGGADQVEDGDAGSQAQGACLVGDGHSGADFLLEPIQAVACVRQPGVDAPGGRVGPGDRGAGCDVSV